MNESPALLKQELKRLRAEVAALRRVQKEADDLLTRLQGAEHRLAEARALFARVMEHMARNGLGWDPAWTAEYNRLCRDEAPECIECGGLGYEPNHADWCKNARDEARRG